MAALGVGEALVNVTTTLATTIMASNVTTATTARIPTSEDNPVSAEYIKELASNLDQFFIVIAGIVIFYIQAGFAFLEAGSVRAKNTTNILLKNTLDTLFGGIAYWMVGHALAFGPGNWFMGTSAWPFLGLPPKEYAHWFYQFVYASTASSIVSGAVAERCSFIGYVSYSILISGFVYPIVSHWAWSPDGWLYSTEFHDFAGSGTVHMLGGCASLAACLLIGPRSDIFDPETGKKRLIRGHSVPLAALGCFTLIFGIMAFNMGTNGHITQVGDGATIALSVTNTVLSAASGGIAALLFRRLGWFVTNEEEKTAWSFLLTINGVFVGMVSICGGCDSMPPWAGVVCGIGAAAVFLNVRRLTWFSKYIDDPLDAIAVHMGGGFWGMVCTGLLHKNGLILAGNPMILAWNMAAVTCDFTWCVGIVGTVFSILRFFNLHRISKEEEFLGMDIVKHNEPAYPVEAWMEEQYFVNGAIVPLDGNPAGGRVKGDGRKVVPLGSAGGAGAVGGAGDGEVNMAFVMHEMSTTRYPVYPVVNADGTYDAASGRRYSMASIRRSSMYGQDIPKFPAGKRVSKISTIQEHEGPGRLRTFSLSEVEKKVNQHAGGQSDEDNVYKTVR